MGNTKKLIEQYSVIYKAAYKLSELSITCKTGSVIYDIDSREKVLFHTLNMMKMWQYINTIQCGQQVDMTLLVSQYTAMVNNAMILAAEDMPIIKTLDDAIKQNECMEGHIYYMVDMWATLKSYNIK